LYPKESKFHRDEDEGSKVIESFKYALSKDTS